MQSERMAATDTRALTPAPHHTPCIRVEGRGWARWFFREAEAALAFAFQLGETETGWVVSAPLPVRSHYGADNLLLS